MKLNIENLKSYQIVKGQNGLVVDNTRVPIKEKVKPIPLTQEQQQTFKLYDSLNRPETKQTYLSQRKKLTPTEQAASDKKLRDQGNLQAYQKQKQKETVDLQHAVEVAPYIIPGIGQAMWAGKAVDLATSGVSDGKYKSWGDTTSHITGDPEWVGDLTNPGYYAGMVGKLATPLVKNNLNKIGYNIGTFGRNYFPEMSEKYLPARLPKLIRQLSNDAQVLDSQGNIVIGNVEKTGHGKINTGKGISTIHFTTDRPVTAHKFSWDGMPAYVTDFENIAKQADIISINPSDTYFNSNLKNITVPAKDMYVVGKKVSGTKYLTSKKLKKLQYSKELTTSVEETPNIVGKLNLTKTSPKASQPVHRNDHALEMQNEIQNIINRKFGKPLLKDYKLLEEVTGMKSNVQKFNNQPEKIINFVKSENPAEFMYPDGDILNKSKLIRSGKYATLNRQPYNNVFYNPSTEHHFKWKGINNFKKGGGLSRKEDYKSKSKPYPSVDKKDFAGGDRSYPIPSKADAVDALRLAGLHGRSDVKTKVYKKYPELKNKNKNENSNPKRN